MAISDSLAEAMHNSEEFSQRIEDCRELYLKHGGEHHELIEREMHGGSNKTRR